MWIIYDETTTVAHILFKVVPVKGSREAHTGMFAEYDWNDAQIGLTLFGAIPRRMENDNSLEGRDFPDQVLINQEANHIHIYFRRHVGYEVTQSIEVGSVRCDTDASGTPLACHVPEALLSVPSIQLISAKVIQFPEDIEEVFSHFKEDFAYFRA